MINNFLELEKIFKLKPEVSDRKIINFKFSEQLVNPQEAYFSPFELVNLDEAEGFISADYFALCPPGFSIIIPGQIITRDIINKLQLSQEFLNLQDGKIKVLLRRV